MRPEEAIGKLDAALCNVEAAFCEVRACALRRRYYNLADAVADLAREVEVLHDLAVELR